MWGALWQNWLREVKIEGLLLGSMGTAEVGIAPWDRATRRIKVEKCIVVDKFAQRSARKGFGFET